MVDVPGFRQGFTIQSRLRSGSGSGLWSGSKIRAGYPRTHLRHLFHNLRTNAFLHSLQLVVPPVHSLICHGYTKGLAACRGSPSTKLFVVTAALLEDQSKKELNAFYLALTNSCSGLRGGLSSRPEVDIDAVRTRSRPVGSRALEEDLDLITKKEVKK